MRATEIKNAVFAAIAAAGSAVAQALGGWDTALAVLVALMAIDYITGLHRQELHFPPHRQIKDIRLQHRQITLIF